MTLTQRVRPGQSWAAAQARLLASFRRFYRNPETRRRVLGGMRRVETTWSRRSQGWHVHIHFVYEGRFWPADELAALWSTYSDGTIVDVREVDRPAEFFKYLLKVAGVPAGKVVEYAVQSSGRRLIEFLGSWRKLEVPEAEDDLDEWFQVDIPRLREALDVCDEDVPYRLHFELPHLGTKDPPALRSWVRRVLASYEKTLGQLCEREVARIFREVARPCRG